ncbi:MAG: 4-hydroxy-3-methylbut-2-enyl diphosphate reductase [Planctomycetota bacterium]|nr:4-hydroxy-3-methylbut-2-enyl diphosphate reductase [Planctomycetota bacterium]
MKIILANPRGFCAGVYMAVDVVDQLLDICGDEPLYVYHEIVHNRHVVDRFEDRGVVFVEDVNQVPHGSIVVFSAHGVSPLLRKQARDRKLQVVDATCPLVTKVHAEAIRYARKGYQILLIGHYDHQEVIGTMGEAPDAIQIVESPEDIPGLYIIDPDKLVYLTQTTLSLDDANICINALKKAFPNLKSPPSEDICYATTNRQMAVQALAQSCDLVLVVGSRNSSNSQRLREIAEASDTPAHLIDDHNELDEAWFDGIESVLVTAGASAPEDLVKGLILHLVQRYQGVVELHNLVDEKVEFGLPGTLKQFMRQRNVDPEGRRISMDSSKAINAWFDENNIDHQTVDLTVGATS